MGGHGSHSLDPVKLEAGDKGMDRDWEDELKEEGLTMITGGLTMLTYQKDEKERAEEEKSDSADFQELTKCKDVHY